ncbi:retrovirus-related pol polyprotein from transposon TNT 1-94 [Tanacetum coccineum]
MQDEIHEFDRLKVWELVPRPDYVMVIGLKWIYKVMLDEYGDVLKDKARLVAKGYRQEEAKAYQKALKLSNFRDKYGMQMLMRFNEIHKFSDGTLQQIDEALDYRVKEFKVNKNNPALNTSSGESSGTWKALLVEEYAKETTDFYGEPNDDIFSVASRTSCVTQAGSPPSMCQTISNIDAHVEGEQFHESKQSRYEFPRSRQSQRDLPRDNSLVSVEVLRYDYKRSNVNKGIVRTEMELVLEHTQQGTSNEVSEILLKMNLPDHRSVLTDPEGQAKMEMEIPRSSGVNSQPHAHT